MNNKYLDLVKKLKIDAPKEEKKTDFSKIYVTLPKAGDLKDGNNQILLRLLPDFVHGKQFNGPIYCSFHLFRSKTTNSMVRVNCSPESETGMRATCPLCRESIRLYKEKKEAERKVINRIVNGYINAYVIHNPFDSDQDGTVRILRFGVKVRPIIDDALTGRYASMFGNRIFDCGADGVTFVLECNKNGQWVDYTRSYFKTPQDSQEDVKKLSDKELSKIYESVFDIEDQCGLKPNTVDEILDVMEKHLGIATGHKHSEIEDSPTSTSKVEPDEDSDDGCATDPDEDEVAPETTNAPSQDEQLKDLLKGL